jgi:hypothetical protein
MQISSSGMYRFLLFFIIANIGRQSMGMAGHELSLGGKIRQANDGSGMILN